MTTCNHTIGLIKGCPLCKVERLEAELETAKSAYSDLLVNSAAEIQKIEQNTDHWADKARELKPYEIVAWLRQQPSEDPRSMTAAAEIIEELQERNEHQYTMLIGAKTREGKLRTSLEWVKARLDEMKDPAA